MKTLTLNNQINFRSILISRKTIVVVYMLLAIIASLKQYFNQSFNNYLIFKYNFIHSINFENLYQSSTFYFDNNHYGPFFALIIAPFALLPDGLGMFLWNVANVTVLLYGIFSLPIPEKAKIIIAWLTAHETLTALFSFQFNIGLTGLILLSFSYIITKKEFKSALAIAAGTLIKLYGIVGLSFLFFSKRKLYFILSGIFAISLMFALPMLLSSPAFVIQSYVDWYNTLILKNANNASLVSFQDISVMGMYRRITGNVNISNFPFLLGGLTIFALPYLRPSQFEHLSFRLLQLASTLIFTVIFSSGSESPTYIIAFAGVAIWFIVQPNPKSTFVMALLIFALLLTSLSPTDIFPRSIKEFIRLHSLKALPCTLIWLHIIYQMLTTNFKNHLSAQK